MILVDVKVKLTVVKATKLTKCYELWSDISEWNATCHLGNAKF